MPSSTIQLLTGCSGLNTKIDPLRIPFDPETGISELAVAINIKLDDTGYPSRRKGYTRLRQESAHSLFCDGYDCLFVAGTTLYRLLPDYSVAVVKDGLSENNRRMAYTQVNNDIYYTNGINTGLGSTVDIGIVREGGTWEAWASSVYVGPDTNRSFDIPRAGNHLAFFSGRIFVLDGKILWWSEPYGFSWFDRTRNFIQLPSTGVMVKSVAGGLFISDKKATYFLAGQDPKSFISNQVAPYPALEWSEAIDYVNGSEIGLEPGDCALWSSLEGACLGTASGNFINLNRDKVVYPDKGNFGVGLFTTSGSEYHFIHNIGM